MSERTANEILGDIGKAMKAPASTPPMFYPESVARIYNDRRILLELLRKADSIMRKVLEGGHYTHEDGLELTKAWEEIHEAAKPVPNSDWRGSSVYIYGAQ